MTHFGRDTEITEGRPEGTEAFAALCVPPVRLSVLCDENELSRSGRDTAHTESRAVDTEAVVCLLGLVLLPAR